jgi:dephospho-CoA kinase
MSKIGLTGGIASGKSLVSNFLRQLGAVIIDADQVAREVVRPGQPVLHQIAQVFGSELVRSEGSLDRHALGKLVFADAEKLERLNQMLHPLIIETIKQRLDHHLRIRPQAVVVVVAPLLYEVGLDKIVDQVWVVNVDLATQLRRLMARDNLSVAEARRRISSQWPLTEKARRADRVINNQGTPEQTSEQVRKLWYEVSSSAI